MPQTRFPRILGDMGNAGTWPFPAQFGIVPGAATESLIRGRAEGLTAPFIDAVRGLAARGVEGITANCGFLPQFQEALKRAAGVPMSASSLIQVPMVNAALPGDRRTGTQTISAGNFETDRLAAAGSPLNATIAGTDGSVEFTTKILGGLPEIDFAKCLREMRQAARDLLSSNSGIGAIVPDCVNMVPFAAGLGKRTWLSVHSIHSRGCWFQAGPAPWQFRFSLADPAPRNERQRRV